jgi:ribonucleoside-diphosphate reductase alpha chain
MDAAAHAAGNGNGNGGANGHGKSNGNGNGNGHAPAPAHAVPAAPPEKGYALAEGVTVAQVSLTAVELTSSAVSRLSSATPSPAADRQRAIQQGFTGDACGACGHFTLVRNGTCLKCMTCGGTSGCS